MFLLGAENAGSVHNGWLLIFIPLFFLMAYETAVTVRFWSSPLGAFRPLSYHLKRVAARLALLLMVTAILLATITQ